MFACLRPCLGRVRALVMLWEGSGGRKRPLFEGVEVAEEEERADRPSSRQCTTTLPSALLRLPPEIHEHVSGWLDAPSALRLCEASAWLSRLHSPLIVTLPLKAPVEGRGCMPAVGAALLSRRLTGMRDLRVRGPGAVRAAAMWGPQSASGLTALRVEESEEGEAVKRLLSGVEAARLEVVEVVGRVVGRPGVAQALASLVARHRASLKHLLVDEGEQDQHEQEDEEADKDEEGLLARLCRTALGAGHQGGGLEVLEVLDLGGYMMRPCEREGDAMALARLLPACPRLTTLRLSTVSPVMEEDDEHGLVVLEAAHVALAASLAKALARRGEEEAEGQQAPLEVVDLRGFAWDGEALLGLSAWLGQASTRGALRELKMGGGIVADEEEEDGGRDDAEAHQQQHVSGGCVSWVERWLGVEEEEGGGGMRRLQRLELRDGVMGWGRARRAAARALGRALAMGQLPGLRVLDVSDEQWDEEEDLLLEWAQGVGEEGAHHQCGEGSAMMLQQLEELRVDGCSVTDGGVAALSTLMGQGWLPRLRCLSLQDNAITATAALLLLHTPPPSSAVAGGLQQLRLGGNPLTGLAEAMGGKLGGPSSSHQSPGGLMSGLQELHIPGCGLQCADLPVLLSCLLPSSSLTVLHLHDNPCLTDDALAESLRPSSALLPANLRSLTVAGTQAGPRLAQALLSAMEVGGCPRLCHVDVLEGDEEGEALMGRRKGGEGGGELRAEWVTWLAEEDD